MRIVMFAQSLLSCWNHGNAHFLRGVVTELQARGHDVAVYEPSDGWSRAHLVREEGTAALEAARAVYPNLPSHTYDPETLDVDATLAGAALVLVHEWNDPALVARIGRHRRTERYRLLFHDTHHRTLTAPEEMGRYDLSDFDGVLAFGKVIRDLYERRGWARRAWTWHEAADVRVFRPIPSAEKTEDLVWIGNWGDDERSAELREFLLEPVRALGLAAVMYGVRYPREAREALRDHGIGYGGWLPNHEVPAAYSRARLTVHVPRRPYAEALPGIPTIRPFEALACGIPLVSAPWHDVEGLFAPGEDFLVARDGREMTSHLRRLLAEPEAAQAMAARGRARVLARHTCAHRVDELLAIHASIA
jgi:spore maturation protein CgeB